MRRIAFLFLLFPIVLSAQEDCELFNLQELAAENLVLHDSIAQFSVDTVIFQPDGSFEVQLSNGTTFTQVQGCTDAAADNYDAGANTDDGSCIYFGCTDSTYVEYNPSANTDDGSCLTLPGCSDSDIASMDGYDYEVVTIGDQCWFAENLRTTVYADGTGIPEVTDDTAWIDADYPSGARCDYNNDASNVATYGRLYNWFAVEDARGLCPSGWHVPTDGEWTELEDYITSQGFAGTEGTALKSYTGWTYNPTANTDDFGFSALPGGNRGDNNGSFWGGGGFGGYWWSSSWNGSGAWYRRLYFDSPGIDRDDYYHPAYGMSVRCLRDIEGCTDPAFTEYNALAHTDDGSCSTPVVEGCTDSAAGNYNAAANTDDGSCIYYGCTDPDADNYDASANTDDGSCIYYGCTDSAYVEYDASANTDDGSCATLVVEGCTDPADVNYNVAANTDDGSCSLYPCSSIEFDGYTYSVVEIGYQCWFSENLRTTIYADGSGVPDVYNYSTWTSLNSGARCDYNNDASNVATYGRLYNWHAVDDARGLCPSGWHVPTDEEWMILEMELGMSESEANSTGFRGTDEGTQLKSTSGWLLGGNGTDDFGFSALPGGARSKDNGIFFDAGYNGSWWSSSPVGGLAWFRFLSNSLPFVYRGDDSPRVGFSVRCLRDAD